MKTAEQILKIKYNNVTESIIFDIIKDHTGTTKQEIKSKLRIMEYLKPRYMFCAIAYTYMTIDRNAGDSTRPSKTVEIGLKAIGRVINRDHSTVINAKVQHRNFMEQDAEYKKTFTAIEKDFKKITSEFQHTIDNEDIKVYQKRLSDIDDLRRQIETLSTLNKELTAQKEILTAQNEKISRECQAWKDELFKYKYKTA